MLTATRSTTNCKFAPVKSKMETFKEDMVICKSNDTPIFTKSFTTTNDSFQMRYCVMLDASNYLKLKILPNLHDKKDFFGILNDI